MKLLSLMAVLLVLTLQPNLVDAAFSQANSLSSPTSPVLVYVEPGEYADGTLTAIEDVYVMGAGRGTNIQGAFTIENGGISNIFLVHLMGHLKP